MIKIILTRTSLPSENAVMIIFITGGVKSGKSAFGLKLAEKMFDRKTYLATAVPEDDEMRERIRKHQHERDETYTTVEEPLDLHRVHASNIILDDLTLWVGNLIFHGREQEWMEILKGFIGNTSDGCIIISNETGWGNIPMDPMTRKYNRLLGDANAFVADRADDVYLMVSGIPLKIKDAGENIRFTDPPEDSHRQ